jgi:hypothetical protein
MHCLKGAAAILHPIARKSVNKLRVRTSKTIGALCEAEQRLSRKGLAKVEGSEVECGSVAKAKKHPGFEDGSLSQLIGLADLGGAGFSAGFGCAIH